MQQSIPSPHAVRRVRTRLASLVVVLLAFVGVLTIPPLEPASAAPLPRSVDLPLEDPFDCPSKGFLVQRDAGFESGGDLFDIDLVSGTYTNTVMPYRSNAAGYNVTDDYIYTTNIDNDVAPRDGVIDNPLGPGGINRIHGDGSQEFLGLPNGWPAGQPLRFAQGDISLAGRYVVGDGQAGEFFVIDMDRVSANFFTMTDHIQNIENPGVDLDVNGNDTDPREFRAQPDLAYVGNQLYQLWTEIVPGSGPPQPIGMSLFRLNLNLANDTGVYQEIGALSFNGGPFAEIGFGALYVDRPNDHIYTSQNSSGMIYRIDLATLQIAEFAQGPSAGQNDGARCQNSRVGVDYGDAPPSYGTYLGNNGPRHTPSALVALGATIDSDADGAPTPTASGDDATGTDDEDAFNGLVLNGNAPSVTVPISNPTGTTVTVAAWLDLNGNLVFDGAAERQMAVTTGSSAVLTWPAANGATQSTYARFRVYEGNVADPQPLGAGTPGEVEDHAVTLNSSYSVQKFADVADGSTVVSGQTINYTIRVTNDGAVAIPASFVDDLSDVVDDAAVTVPAQAGASYAGNVLTWSGTVPAFGFVDVTYSAVVNRADQWSSAVLNNGVVGGTNCPAGSPADYPCGLNNPTAGYVVDKVATVSDGVGVSSGQSITYTITLFHRGTAPMAAASFTDDISDVLDDATITGEPTNGAVRNGNVISWTGDLAVGEVRQFQYTALVDAPAGFVNAHLSNVVVGGSNCSAGMPADYPCGINNPTGGYTIEKFATVLPDQPVRPGDTIAYTVRVRQGGLAPVTGATFTDDLADVLDDANLVGGPSAGSITGTVLSWTGDLAVGQVVDVTYTVQVRPANQFGNATLSNVAIGGSNCPPVPPPVPPCGQQNLVGGYTVEKVHSVPAGQSLQPGDTVTYTITVRHTGDAAYIGATFSDDLADVLDDATLIAGPSAGTINGTVLSWTGDLAVGQVVQITYTVQVKPAEQFGSGTLDNAVFGGQCPLVNPPPECNPPGIPLRGYIVSKASNPPSLSTVTPGQDVTYTITIRQVGDAAYNGATLSDELVDVFDDAALTVAPVASTGTVNLTGDDLTWTGNLAVGAVETITYTVRVDNVDDLGNGLLLNVVTGPGCPPGTMANHCRPWLPVGAYRVAKSSNPLNGTTVRPGDTVTYTITVTQVGLGAVTNAMVTDDLTDVLDDAVVTGEPTNGATRSGNVVSWSGPLAVGQVVTFSYTVTVDPPQNLGSGALVNGVEGPNCPANATAPPCVLRHPVAGHLIAKTSDPVNGSTVIPGELVTYTITVTQVGTAAATGLTVNDNLAGILDDAVLVGTPTASSGTVGITGSTLTWTGALNVGANATISYQVRVNAAEDFGDASMPNAATSPLSNCVTPQPGCISTVLAGAYTIDKTSDVPAGTVVDAGTQVTYTLTLTHLGAGALIGKTVNDDLSDVLDDGVIAGTPTATSGSVSITGDTLTWTGNLVNDQVVTVTYVLQVNPPRELGDGVLLNVVTSPDPETDCPEPAITDPTDPDYNPDCVKQDDTTGNTVIKTSNPADGTLVQPRDVVTYTLTITNTGSVALPGHQVFDDLSNVLDDATILDAPTADVGTVVLVGNDLTWTGDLASKEVAVVTYSVVVNDPDEFGDAHLGNVVTAAGVTNCPEPAITDPQDPLYDPDCHEDHDAEGWTQLKTSDPEDGSEVKPGDTVTYTLTFTNTGTTDLTDLEAIDDLSDVLDDAVIDEAPTADVGTVELDGTTLTWTGDLDEGEVATVTYSVIVNQPDEYTNGHLGNVVTANGPSDCIPPAITEPTDPNFDPDCYVEEFAEGYTVVKASDPADGTTVKPNTVVTYTLTLTNTGDVALTGEAVTDDLSNVLDDATLEGTPSADGGTVAIEGTTLTWTGDLAIDQVVVVTYEVLVNRADLLGNGELGNVVVSTGSTTCPDPAVTDPQDPAYDPNCLTDSPIGAYSTVKTLVSPADPKPGDVVTFQIVVTSTGSVPVTGASFNDDLSGVLDDGLYNNDAVVGGPGTLSYTQPVLSWTGDLAVDEVATITYSVTLNRAISGDADVRNIVSSEYCTVAGLPAGQLFQAVPLVSPEMPPGCVVTELIPGIRLTKATSNLAPKPGDRVTYTITATNIGKAPLIGGVFTDDLSDVLDDATYSNDHSVDIGTVTYSQPVLTWLGDLQPGQTATLTYSFTVNATGGNNQLGNTVISDSVASNCTTGNVEAVCVAVSPVVREAEGLPTPDELPRTGGSVAGVVRLALILLLAGLAVTLVATRRRRRAVR